MTKNKKKTVWITIPDDSGASKKISSQPKEVSDDRVTNKVFWGGGFVAMIAFMGMLFTPSFMSPNDSGDSKPSLPSIQANLFDGSEPVSEESEGVEEDSEGGFQFIPDFDKQQEQSGTFFGGEEGNNNVVEGVSEAVVETVVPEENVVEAESEAVSIQVDPVSEPIELPITDAEGNPVQTLTESVSEPEEVSSEISSETQALLDANTRLLEDLTKQLDDLEQRDADNQKTIDDLKQLVEDQTLRPAAMPPEVDVTVLPVEQPTQFNQIQQPQVGPGGYRYNTHTVTVSPHDVLAQNQGIRLQAQAQQQVSYQASVVDVPQSYNGSLSGVQAHAETGPGLIIVLLVASFGVLIWGSVRAARA